MKRPFAIWLLASWLVFLALGGFYGGIAMLLEPSGKLLHMDIVLPLLPVPNYLLPGLFLISIMGLLPMLLAYALLWRPYWPAIQKRITCSNYYWAWTLTIAHALLLLIWLLIQALLIGFRWPVQIMTLINGLLILVLAFLPAVRKFEINYLPASLDRSNNPSGVRNS